MSKAKQAGAGFQFFAALLCDVLNPLLVMSMALYVSLGYILILLMPVTIEIWTALFWLTLLLPLAALSLRAYRKWQAGATVSEPFSWRVLLPCIPLLIFIPGIFAVLSSPTLQVSNHGDIHLGYIYQLLYGAAPVDDVFVPGHPANYYWLYHAWLAAIIRISSLPPPFVAAVADAIAIFSALLWLMQTLVILKIGRPRTIYLGLLAVLVYCAVNITGILSLLAHLVNGTFEADTLRIMLFDGADRRLHSVLGKVLNFTSMTLGITLFSAALYACVRMVKDKANLFSLVLISACGLSALAVREIAALYIAVVLLGGLAVTAVSIWMRRPSKGEQILIFWHDLKSRVSPMILSLWFAGSLVLALALVKYSLGGVVGLQDSRPLSLPDSANVEMIVAAVLLLLPLFALQCAFVWRQKDAGQHFIQIAGLLALLLTSMLTLPDGNQYKGVYFLAMLMAISALFALQTMQNSRQDRWQWLGWIMTGILLALVFSKVLYANYHYIRQAGYSVFQYDGIHIAAANESDSRLSAYYWIRKHTPLDAIVAVPLKMKQAGWKDRYVNIFHERLLYVKLEDAFANIPAYDERTHDLELLYSGETGAADYAQLLERMTSSLPGRPIYAVVKDEEVSAEVMAQRGAKPVYEHEGDGANVYWLNPE